MRPIRLVSLLTTLFSTLLLAQTTPANNPLVSKTAAVGLSESDPAMQEKIAENYGKLPLSFEANHGQADGRVKFLSHMGGYTLFLTGDEAVLVMRGKNAKKSSPSRLRPVSLAGLGGEVKAMHLPKANDGTVASRDDVAAEDTTGSVLRMKLRNANPAAGVTGLDERAGTSNYFIGNDPAKWRSGVRTYAKVKYEGIYSGIDLVYYGNQRQLEYDFIVAPGADPHRISFDVRGAKRIRRDAHGDLVLTMERGEGEIRWHKPVVYQEKNGARQEVAARYAITDAYRVGFEVAKYDSGRPLYIDPLIYSTYLGGNSSDFGQGIAVDTAGNAYVVGFTISTDFPTKNPLQPGNGSPLYVSDAFVAKLNPTGSALVYSTYLGGGGYEYGRRIAVDSAGNAYVTGITYSTDFPTKDPLQATLGGFSDAFVAKINPTGSALVYSTYLGGSGYDYGEGIAVDRAGNASITGYTASADFPTKNPLQISLDGGSDAFVAKLNSTGSALVYSTYLGGSSLENGYGMAVDSAGNAYVTGITYSTDFPTKDPLQATLGGFSDAFVAKINPTGSALVYSTYLGGSGYDYGEGIAVDRAGNAYLTGVTNSTDFPTMNPVQPAYGGGGVDAFVAKVNPTGSTLVYSTYLGGSGNEDQDNYNNHDLVPSGIAVDSMGNAYVTGNTFSTDFPTTPGAFQEVCYRNHPQICTDNGDAFVTRLDSTGSALVYSTYLGGQWTDMGGGIAVDSTGNAYVTGFTVSLNFPIKKPLDRADSQGNGDAFVTKIDVRGLTTTTLSSSLNPSTYGQAVTFAAVVASSLGAPPDGETVTFRQFLTVLGTGTLSSGSASFSTSAVGAGTKSITAVYAGDASFAVSTSKVLSQVVNKATTSTTLISSQNPSSFNQSVTFTATVAPEFGGTPTGTVTFYDGTTAVKTGSLMGGVTRFTTAGLGVGTHSITVVYNGNASFLASTSNALSQVVKKATTTTKLVSSLNPSKVGQSVGFTATVTAQFGGTLTGTVTFKDGTTTLGTVTLTSHVAGFTTSTLATGTHNITATYNGSPDCATSSASLIQTVN